MIYDWHTPEARKEYESEPIPVLCLQRGNKRIERHSCLDDVVVTRYSYHPRRCCDYECFSSAHHIQSTRISPRPDLKGFQASTPNTRPVECPCTPLLHAGIALRTRILDSAGIFVREDRKADVMSLVNESRSELPNTPT